MDAPSLNLMPEFFRSVEWVWAVWLLGLLALGALATGVLRAARRNSAERRAWRGLNGCEAGAAYSLSYMLTIPLIALIICLVVDLTLILVAKIGTVYAAYAAARAAVVWVPSGVSPGTAQDKVEAAAQNAMTPFASSNARHRPITTPPPSGLVYYAAHKSFAENPADFDYIGWKWLYASWATKVTVDGGNDYKKDVTVTLDYKAPFHMPAIGRIFGSPTLFGFYTTNIHTVVKLENQAPRSDEKNPPSRPLGISYVPAAK
ncbi:MAG: hypothetical protein C0483_10005 [Pirellula sp.]|nr:hypothetical protein [Pirellula sp.]